MNTYGIALIERPHDEGINQEETVKLFSKLHGRYGIPYEVDGEYSSAMGFINLSDAEIMDYNYGEGSGVYQFIQSILNDMGNENESKEYSYESHGEFFTNTIDIYIGR